MDTSTRRAFALDSRTVWVEQQLVNSTLVAKDNLVLGPGEYNAKVLERHISTPSLGGPKKGIDFIPSFRSELNVRTPLGKGSPSRAHSPSKRGLNNSSSFELRDFSTSFHEHDSRQPFDPKNGFCPTPGSYLSHTPVVKILKHDGVYETKSTVPFGGNTVPVPFGERCPTKQALPDYDPKFDSNQLRPATKYGSFQKADRIYIPTAEDSHKHNNNTSAENSEEEMSPTRRRALHRQQQQQQSPSGEQKLSVFEARCRLVPMPKLKYRSPPVLLFDDSSYKNEKNSKPLDLTPKQINTKARIHLYDKILAIPRKHHSMGVTVGKLVVKPAHANTTGNRFGGEGNDSDSNSNYD